MKSETLVHRKRKTKPKKKFLDESDANVKNWHNSFSNEDPFDILTGSSDGGFISLEEIEELEYRPHVGVSEGSKHKKQKGKDFTLETDSPSFQFDDDVMKREPIMKKTRKKKRKKPSCKSEKDKPVIEYAKVTSDEHKDTPDEPNDFIGSSYNIDYDIDESDFYLWKELRLHPLLMKAIYKLGFKEPTPIQKACIPVAAHQGKDVIGAAETGSGKTLAFGIPIFQRLLEELDKEARFPKTTVVKDNQGKRLRALIVTPTRELCLQVCDHLRSIGKHSKIKVIPIVGGMSTEKQERLLKKKPEIVVGTPGRLWELMTAGGNQHLVELHELSFFVLDEADRMIENGHFQELQSIIDMLPIAESPVQNRPISTVNCETVLNVQQKKRQTFVFSATLSLSANFRKKLKRGPLKTKHPLNTEISSIEILSERAGVKADAAIVDLTSASIVSNKLEESFIECNEEDKDAHLYYILSIHGHGRTIVFCTSIAALRRISSLLRILKINVWTLHAQMQQRARLKAIDRFRESEWGILIATDVAARGLDIPGVRTVIHYQLPHSAEVYIHRSGRTARALSDGCSIALISSKDQAKFASLCRSFSKDSLKWFPVDSSYMPEIAKRLSLARQIDGILQKDSQEKKKKNWFHRYAESVELVLEDSGSEEERVHSAKHKKINSLKLMKLQEEIMARLSCPLQPKTFSHRFLAGSGVSPLIQQQLQELSMIEKKNGKNSTGTKRSKLVVIGQNCMEPLQALRTSGHEVSLRLKDKAEKQLKLQTRKRKKAEEKKRLHEKQRKERKKRKIAS